MPCECDDGLWSTLRLKRYLINIWCFSRITCRRSYKWDFFARFQLLSNLSDFFGTGARVPHVDEPPNLFWKWVGNCWGSWSGSCESIWKQTVETSPCRSGCIWSGSEAELIGEEVRLSIVSFVFSLCLLLVCNHRRLVEKHDSQPNN